MDGGFCTACGAQVPEGALFCGACGTRVQAAAPTDPAVAPPPLPTPAAATPAEAAIPTHPAAAPPAAVPPAPPPMATPAYAPPPVPKSNPPWIKILSAIVGAGLLIFGAVKLYNAFFGAPGSSSEVRQMEDQIRRDFQARGQQVSQVQMTAQSRDRMTGSATIGNPAGSGSQYNCTATRQSGSYFSYQCEPASGSSTSMPTTPTPSSMAPMGAPTPSAGTGLTAMTPAQRAEAIAECTDEERSQVADPASFCTCAIDRLAAGISRGQAVSECATRLGIPVPRD